jgi:hypothetical protein
MRGDNVFNRLMMIAALVPFAASAQPTDGVIMRCGASAGHGYFFKYFTKPDGPDWQVDGISTGKIILVRLGDEWDIQFDDFLGASGYRNDGAKVIPLLETEGFLTVGAFGPWYVDIYTFDLMNRDVGWTSNKHGPISAKAAAYSAKCE